MFESILLAVKNLVEEIYTTDQNQLDSYFVLFLDELEKLVIKMEKIDFRVDVSEELTVLQECYKKRDLVELADFLLYELEPNLLELQGMVKSTNAEDK